MIRKSLFVLVLGFALLLGCGSTQQTEQEFFGKSMNFTPPAGSVSNFQGERSDEFPAFLTRGMATYQAQPAFFDALLRHSDFIQDSAANSRFRQLDCGDLSSDFSYWTSQPVSLNGKVCYTGTFMPFVHYLIYDPRSMQVQHFYKTIRD